MGRPLTPSKRLKVQADIIRGFAAGMSARDIQRISGWSKATFYRRVARPDFPTAQRTDRGKVTWNALEVFEWISRFNLEAALPRQDFLKFERDLVDRAQTDTKLQFAYGRLIEREFERRERENSPF